MGEITIEKPLFQVRAAVRVSTSPEATYALVSDMPRSVEWSPECTGGKWVSGEPATVGAVFLGTNYRAEDVVSWAPVVRGDWNTESEVITAEPPRTFRWSMRNTAGRRQDSVWAFDIEPADGGSLLVHHFRMGEPTEGIRGITAEMDDSEKQRFFAEWAAKIEGDLAVTLQRIKVILEQE